MLAACFYSYRNSFFFSQRGSQAVLDCGVQSRVTLYRTKSPCQRTNICKQSTILVCSFFASPHHSPYSHILVHIESLDSFVLGTFPLLLDVLWSCRPPAKQRRKSVSQSWKDVEVSQTASMPRAQVRHGKEIQRSNALIRGQHEQRGAGSGKVPRSGRGGKGDAHDLTFRSHVKMTSTPCKAMTEHAQAEKSRGGGCS